MNKQNNWWRLILIFYARMTSWIIFPALLAYVMEKYVFVPVNFLILVVIAFMISLYGIWREIKKYQNTLSKETPNNQKSNESNITNGTEQ